MHTCWKLSSYPPASRAEAEGIRFDGMCLNNYGPYDKIHNDTYMRVNRDA